MPATQTAATALTSAILRSAYSITADGARELAVSDGNGAQIRGLGFVRSIEICGRHYYILTPSGASARSAAIEARRAA